MTDLSNMYEYDLSPVLPVLIPRDWPYAPLHEPSQGEYYRCTFVQRGTSSLDTYVAPPINIGAQYYDAKARQGNGIVVYGNAPTSGIYTGVQQE